MLLAAAGLTKVPIPRQQIGCQPSNGIDNDLQSWTIAGIEKPLQRKEQVGQAGMG